MKYNTKKHPKVYALYKGDKFIDIGTKAQLMVKHNMKYETITFYLSNAYKKRLKERDSKDAIIIIEVEDDE